MFLLTARPLLAIIVNSWTYGIYHTSAMLGTLLVTQTIFCYFALLKKNKTILYTLIFVLFAFYALTQIKDFDLSAVRRVSSSPELMKIEQRQLYYKTELNWYYWNKYGKKYFDGIKPVLDRYTQKLYAGMDLSLYFGDYKIILFPLFAAGLIFVLKSSNIFIFVFFLLSFFIQSLFQIRDGSGYFYYYPFINSTVALGAYMFFKRNEKS